NKQGHLDGAPGSRGGKNHLSKSGDLSKGSSTNPTTPSVGRASPGRFRIGKGKIKTPTLGRKQTTVPDNKTSLGNNGSSGSGLAAPKSNGSPDVSAASSHYVDAPASPTKVSNSYK